MFSKDWKWLLSDDIMQRWCTDSGQWASCSSHKASGNICMKMFRKCGRQSTTKQKDCQHHWNDRTAQVIAARRHVNRVGLREMLLSRPRRADFHHLGEGTSVRRGLETCLSCDVNVVEQLIQPRMPGVEQREFQKRNSRLFSIVVQYCLEIENVICLWSQWWRPRSRCRFKCADLTAGSRLLRPLSERIFTCTCFVPPSWLLLCER